jgi:hypothetical protein
MFGASAKELLLVTTFIVRDYVLSNCLLCNKHCDDTIVICQFMCAIDSWGAHESFKHPIFILKNRCDKTLSL